MKSRAEPDEVRRLGFAAAERAQQRDEGLHLRVQAGDVARLTLGRAGGAQRVAQVRAGVDPDVEVVIAQGTCL
jgi:hypothetical protein